jgi:hypothetical protein
MEQAKAWLEEKPKPKMIEPPKGIKDAATKFFKLSDKAAITSAIVGPPRTTGHLSPKFYAWLSIEDGTSKTKKVGAARFEMMKPSDETAVEMTDFVSEAELKNGYQMETMFPWDAIVVIKKIIK